MHFFLVFVFARSPNQQPTFCFMIFVFVVHEVHLCKKRASYCVSRKIERLMCEVEFWEVF